MGARSKCSIKARARGKQHKVRWGLLRPHLFLGCVLRVWLAGPRFTAPAAPACAREDSHQAKEGIMKMEAHRFVAAKDI